MERELKKLNDSGLKLKGLISSLKGVDTWTLDSGLSKVIEHCNTGHCDNDDLVYQYQRVEDNRKEILAFLGLSAQLPKILKDFASAFESFKIELETQNSTESAEDTLAN